ncbi:FtsX-like permease family protein [Demequina sp. NBRC 110054]|uniref:FtsX-like permease family protein n=1 Tax=Demequina sp. NBRC 110054 TaxID=1570343 RepID=UPI000A04A442|nr:FtsX-like permease family protein [Demequina sp. NBRC 110054]
MIGQLLRENLRAHRTYLTWTTALLALAVGFTSFTAYVAAQQAWIVDYVAAAHGQDGEWWTNVGIGDSTAAAEVFDYATILTQAELDALVTQANSDGAGLVATMEGPAELAAVGTSPDLSLFSDRTTIWNTLAMTGAVEWDALLAAGTAPGKGEVAVSATTASALGLEIGDTLRAGTWSGSDGDEFVELGTLKVSGLLRPPLEERYAVWQEEAIIDWDSAQELSALAAQEAGIGTDYDVDGVALFAQHVTPQLAGLGASRPPGGWYESTGVWDLSYLMLAAGVLAVGLLGMAFAVGRSQAQARMRWVATARVLGARRSTIVGATVLETLGVGLLAGVVGAASAYALVVLDWERLVSANPDALIPPHASIARWIPLAMVALAVVIAAIIGAIPAFWSARVAPAAALKPVTPLTEARLSRLVPMWPLLSLWGLCALGALVLVHGIPGDQGWANEVSQTAGFWALASVAAIAAGLTSVALTVEITRRAVSRLATALSRARRPWLIAAGTALAGRPAVASAPAAVLALAATLGAGLATYVALLGWADQGNPYLASSTPQGQWLGPFAFAASSATGSASGAQGVLALIVGGLLVLVALAAFLSARASTVAEDRAQAALGLDAGSVGLASAAQFGLPLALGTVVGGVLGVAGGAALFRTTLFEFDAQGSVSARTEAGAAWAFTHLTHAVLPTFFVIAVLLGTIALGSLVAGMVARVGTRPRASLGA